MRSDFICDCQELYDGTLAEEAKREWIKQETAKKVEDVIGSPLIHEKREDRTVTLSAEDLTLYQMGDELNVDNENDTITAVLADYQSIMDMLQEI